MKLAASTNEIRCENCMLGTSGIGGINSNFPPICHQEGIWLTNHNTAMYVFNGIGPIRMIECGIMN